MPSKPTRTNDLGRIDDADSFKYAPLQQLRTLYVAFAKGLFSSAPAGSYRYVQNPDGSMAEESEIYITDEGPVKTDIAGPRPSISFTRGPVQFYSLGMDDMLDFRFDTGSETKSVLIPGTMFINCSSRSGIESENVAWVLAEHLWLLRKMLIGTDLFFEIGRQPQVGAPSPAEGIVSGDAGDEWYCTTVTSPFQFPRKSRYTPLNKQIASAIELQIRQHLLSAKQWSNGGPAASQNGTDAALHTCVEGAPSFAPDASDARGRTPDPGGRLPAPPTYMPHPLDPARQVRVRTTHPYRPGVRPPSMGGRAIPIAERCVEESKPSSPIKTKV